MVSVSVEIFVLTPFNFILCSGAHFFVIDESKQARENYQRATMRVVSNWIVKHLCSMVKAAPRVASSDQLCLAATCGLDSARRHELITRGLAEMVSLVLNMSDPINHQLKKKFNEYKNVCRILAKMSNEWVPNPIQVTSWMDIANGERQLMRCLSAESTRKYLQVVNSIFHTAYFVSRKNGVLALKQNVSLRTPFTFLCGKVPLTCDPHEEKVQFVKKGDVLILIRDIDASAGYVDLLVHSPSATNVIDDNDDTELQHVEPAMLHEGTEPQSCLDSEETMQQEQDVQDDPAGTGRPDDLLTEAQRHEEGTEPQSCLDGEETMQQQQMTDDLLTEAQKTVTELAHLVARLTDTGKRKREDKKEEERAGGLVIAIDALLINLKSMRDIFSDESPCSKKPKVALTLQTARHHPVPLQLPPRKVMSFSDDESA